MTYKVKAEMCSTCIFRPGNPMSLRSGRVRGMVEQARAEDTFIVCHDTIGRDEAMCRGYIDAGNQPQLYRIADRLGILEEV